MRAAKHQLRNPTALWIDSAQFLAGSGCLMLRQQHEVSEARSLLQSTRKLPMLHLCLQKHLLPASSERRVVS